MAAMTTMLVAMKEVERMWTEEDKMEGLAGSRCIGWSKKVLQHRERIWSGDTHANIRIQSCLV